MTSYDLSVIGSGPCGYVAAIRAAQLGMKVCLFEKDAIGGVCLNWGCIPAKAISVSAGMIYDIERSKELGVNIKDYEIDFSKINERKLSIIKKLASGIEMLLKARKIDVIRAHARITDDTRVAYDDKEINAKNILIAAGSIPFELNGMPFDKEYILSSSDILALKRAPKSIVIIGGGVIGCEFASIFTALGSKITIIEATPQLLPNEDAEVARKLEQIFKRRGTHVFTNVKAEKIELKNGLIDVMISNGKIIQAEKALIAVGRRPNISGLGAEEIGLDNNKGWLKVDRCFKTNKPSIYAAGDIIGGLLLAHVASREGIVTVEAMCGKEQKIDYNAVPNCIFTYPEIGSVGLTEKAAREKGLEVSSRKFLFSAIGKAHILGETEGFVKLVVESGKDTIVGAHIIGSGATWLIPELSICVQFGITSEALAGVIHAHPTLSEAIQEASEAVHNKAIHSL